MNNYNVTKPTIAERFKHSASMLFRGRLAESKAKRPKTVLMWPKWRETQATWQLIDLSAFIHEGFNLNSVVYSAIMYKVRAAQSAPLRAYVGTRDKAQLAPLDHPLARLLDRPNYVQSFIEFDALSRVYFNLFGNCYIWFQRQRRDDWPASMITLRPDRVQHIYRDGRLIGFVFIPEGATLEAAVPLLIEDTMHVKLPNPGDPFGGAGKGLSPMFPLSQSADVDNAATAYLRLFFQYGAMPPGILSYEVEMTDAQVATARERWMEIHGGSQNWADITVLDQGGTYQRAGLTFDELAMPGLDARNESRIAMPFGVPLTLIETRPQLVQSTYSNKETDREMFWDDTMIPELRWYEIDYMYYLRNPADAAFPMYDLNHIPALINRRNKRLELMLNGVSRGVFTRAEAKEAAGMPFAPNDNVYMIPLGVQVVPANAQPAAVNETDAAAAVDDDEQRDETEAEPTPESEPEEADEMETAAMVHKQTELSADVKQRTNDTIDGNARMFESMAEKAAFEAFDHDRKKILSIVTDAGKAAVQQKASVNWTLVLPEINRYLFNASKEQWRTTFAPVFNAIVLSVGGTLNTMFGMSFDVRNLLAEDWLANYKMVFVDPLAQTSSNEITQIFQQAFADGWSIPEMQKNLGVLFDQWMNGNAADMTDEERERTYFAEQRLPNYRKEIIARTETIRASNAGATALYKNWGVRKKEWFATADDRTRPTHQVGAAFGLEPLVVEIHEPFMIGGSALQFPGDPNAPLSETAQCRCTVLPVFT